MHRLAVAEAVARLTCRRRGAGCAPPTAASPPRSRPTTPTRRWQPTTTSTGSRSRSRGNRALATVLDQFGPVVRRLERRRFASDTGSESVALHERLVEACAAGDAEAAAKVAFGTWQASPT